MGTKKLISNDNILNQPNLRRECRFGCGELELIRLSFNNIAVTRSQSPSCNFCSCDNFVVIGLSGNRFFGCIAVTLNGFELLICSVFLGAVINCIAACSADFFPD